MRVFLTGAAGFIARSLERLLDKEGIEWSGIDNARPAVDRPWPNGVTAGDARSIDNQADLMKDGDVVVAAAAMMGGVGYFNRRPYGVLRDNSQIVAATCEAALWRRASRVVMVSSSIVYDGTNEFPTPEGAQLRCPPPRTAYGMQKLTCETFAVSLWRQHQIPYTIVRPFNAIGPDEQPPQGATQDDGEMHVVPDLIRKMQFKKRGEPIPVFGDGSQYRHYTYVGDVARGILEAMRSSKAVNEDYNIACPYGHTVRELAEMIHERICPDDDFELLPTEGWPLDVQKRVPAVSKAERDLHFQALTSLGDVLDLMLRDPDDRSPSATTSGAPSDSCT